MHTLVRFCWNWTLNMKLNFEWFKYHRFSFCLMKDDSSKLLKEFCLGICKSHIWYCLSPATMSTEWYRSSCSAISQLTTQMKLIHQCKHWFLMCIFAIYILLSKADINITISMKMNSKELCRWRKADHWCEFSNNKITQRSESETEHNPGQMQLPGAHF